MIISRRFILDSASGMLAIGLVASAGLVLPAIAEDTEPATATSSAAVEADASTAPTTTTGLSTKETPPAAEAVADDTAPVPDADALTETVEQVVVDAAPAPDSEALTETVEEIVEETPPASETTTDVAEQPVSVTQTEAAEAKPIAEPASAAAETSEAGAEDQVAEDTIPAPAADTLTETVKEIVEDAPPAPEMTTEVTEQPVPATPTGAAEETATASEETADAEEAAQPDSEVRMSEDAEPAQVTEPETETASETASEAVEEPAADTADIPPSPAPEEISGAVKAAIADGTGINKTYADAVGAFYSKRDFAPLWISEGKLDGAARAVVHRLEAADAYGLDPSRYVTPSLDIGLAAPVSPSELAAAELAMTVAAVRFAQDAQAGTFDPAALGDLMTARPVKPKQSNVLDGLATASDKVAYLEGFNPPHTQFKALQTLLAKVRDRSTTDAPPQIGDGPSLKPGMTDERVPALRARMDVAPVEGEGALVYDDATVEAVKAFQKEASLDVDGVIGPQTRAALNGGAEITVADILVNMERWRWVPRDMGSLHVWVNIPEYWLRVVGNGTPIFETRVIVGKPENQTPIFSDEIEYVDVNPFWNVPHSIAVKEMLPHIKRDPSFLERQGLQVLYKTGGQEYFVSPYAVDWSQFSEDNLPFRFRQPPGGGNALGRVKFMFPNQHAVYLHDTPTRNLFAKSVRAFSHGCVRVDKPVDFADALLSREDQLNGQRIKNLISGGANGELPMKRHVPVHLTYFTVWVDSAGETQKRPDIYDYDERMKSAMGLGT